MDTLTTLNKLASEVQRFKTCYHCASARSRSGFPGSSPRPAKPIRKQVVPKIIYSEPRPELSLDQLAHEATRPEFRVYPDLRQMHCARTMFGRRQHDFLYRQKVNTPRQSMDQDCLKELNRLARVAELSRDALVVYPDAPRLHILFGQNRSFKYVLLRRLSLIRHDFEAAEFECAFPGTSRPAVTFFSGQPRIQRDLFNELVSSKSKEFRSRFGLTSTPEPVFKLLCNWINKILSSTKPNPATRLRNKRRNRKETKLRKLAARAQKFEPATAPAEQTGTSITVARPVPPPFVVSYLSTKGKETAPVSSPPSPRPTPTDMLAPVSTVSTESPEFVNDFSRKMRTANELLRLARPPFQITTSSPVSVTHHTNCYNHPAIRIRTWLNDSPFHQPPEQPCHQDCVRVVADEQLLTIGDITFFIKGHYDPEFAAFIRKWHRFCYAEYLTQFDIRLRIDIHAVHSVELQYSLFSPQDFELGLVNPNMLVKRSETPESEL